MFHRSLLLALSLSCFAMAAQAVSIPSIQGVRFQSPYLGQTLRTEGVVTALTPQGFYLQDPVEDGDARTSQALWVESAQPIKVGQRLRVTGQVVEQADAHGETGLTRTALVAQDIEILGQAPLPAPVVLGQGGRIIPNQRVSRFIGDVHTQSSLNLQDGLDFYESLEGMRVRLPAFRLVATGTRYGDLFGATDGGRFTQPSLNARSGLVIQSEAEDFNPEIVHLKDPHNSDVGFKAWPTFAASRYGQGDEFQGDIVGILDYNLSKRPGYFVYPTDALPEVKPGVLKPEVTTLVAGSGQLTVANFNVENFTLVNPKHLPDKDQRIARHIVKALAAPDILLLQEVADNDGPTAEATPEVHADKVLQHLVDVIAQQGGPRYRFVEIAPENGQDGGQPHGNIRVAYLYRPDRVQLRSAPQGDSNTPVALDAQGHLTLNPGRVAPQDPAFVDTRKSVAVEFQVGKHSLICINNHLSSKRGDTPLWSAMQPPVLHSEPARLQQTRILRDFVAQIQARNPQAAVLLAGDFNDFYASAPLRQLTSLGLYNLIEQLPLTERYTYVYNGSSQSLDQFLISAPMFRQWQPEVDVVHVNAELSETLGAASDHDPVVARFTLP